jgi:RsiW-degrading membrane proteinase PrsW (M82 family)
MGILDITLGKLLTFGGYAIPAIAFWYVVFRMQNEKALKPEAVRDTFFIGIFSVIPLFLYQYIYSTWLPKLSTGYLGTIFQNQNFLTSILQILLAFVVLGIFFWIIISGFTLFYSFFTKDSFTNTLKALTSEPLNFSATGIIFLFVLLIDLLLRTLTPWNIPTEVMATTFILALLEEYSKHLIVRLFDDHKIKSISNAIELSIIVALSFGFAENIVYFATAASNSIQNVIIGRSAISVFGHIIFSAIFGYYYGIAKFSESVMHVTSVETHEPKLPKWFHSIFNFNPKRTFKAEKIFEGLIFASLAHTIFNLLLQYSVMIGVIALLFAGGQLVFYLLRNDIVKRNFSVVGSKAMPEEDFEKLVWKISVMKHLKEIQKEHAEMNGQKQ